MPAKARLYLAAVIFLVALLAGFWVLPQYRSLPPENAEVLNQSGNWLIVRRKDDKGEIRCFVMSQQPLGVYAYQVDGEGALYWLLNDEGVPERWVYQIDEMRVGRLSLTPNVDPELIFSGPLFDRVLKGESLQLQALSQANEQKILNLDLTGLEEAYSEYLERCPETVASIKI